jgi:hypothetical protein
MVLIYRCPRTTQNDAKLEEGYDQFLVEAKRKIVLAKQNLQIVQRRNQYDIVLKLQISIVDSSYIKRN